MSKFFDVVRGAFGPLAQGQVDGINAMRAATNAELSPVKHRAYMLATAWHETARTMQPIYERGPKSYFDKYNAGTKLGRALGNTLPGDGYRFRGVGYVQLTGRANFVRMGKALGLDLVGNPALAARPDIAARIIVMGMTKGMFTGKKMADFDNYRSMRRVVNGTDRAELIAGYAMTFEVALFAGLAEPPEKPVQAAPAPLAPTQPAIPTSPPVQAAAKPASGLWAWLASLFSKPAA